MTVKKMSKILTFILVLAMVLSTVAMAAEGDSTGTPTATTTYTITAGTLTNGSISLTLVGSDGNDTSLGNITATGGKIENIAKDSKVKVVFVPNPGYEFLRASDSTGKTIKDGEVLTITDNLTIKPEFAPKASCVQLHPAGHLPQCILLAAVPQDPRRWGHQVHPLSRQAEREPVPQHRDCQGLLC